MMSVILNHQDIVYWGFGEINGQENKAEFRN